MVGPAARCAAAINGRRFIQSIGAALILIGTTLPAFTQAQRVIVTRDRAPIWRGQVHTVAVSAKVGTVLDVIRREGNWYVVAIPSELGDQNETGLIAASHVQPAPSREVSSEAHPTPLAVATPQLPSPARPATTTGASNSAGAASASRSGAATSTVPASSAAALPSAAKQRIDVTIIDRLDNATQYTYVVPGFWNANSNAIVNCAGVGNTVSCDGSTSTTELGTTSHPVSYSVRGATLSLKLPDGRLAVVNCDSKYFSRGDYVNRRSCRMPLVNRIETEFSGDKARLYWTTGVDGSKMESETYKILAVLDRP
jgi:hypothetical protein